MKDPHVLWIYGKEFLDRKQTWKIAQSFPVMPTMLYCHMDRDDEQVKAEKIPPTIRLSRPTPESLEAFFADDNTFNALTNAYLYYGGENSAGWDVKVLISPHTWIQREIAFDHYDSFEQELIARGLPCWPHLAAVFYRGKSSPTGAVEDTSIHRLHEKFLRYGKILTEQIIPLGQENNYLLGLRHGDESAPLLSKDDFAKILLRNQLLRNL
ncbi:hypothetical protein HYU22_05575 [Candidatus Woesearchaeota archaeon]|nr:hypothetical protein [Candidatus Woesearchaeota archaeon]